MITNLRYRYIVIKRTELDNKELIAVYSFFVFLFSLILMFIGILASPNSNDAIDSKQNVFYQQGFYMMSSSASDKTRLIDYYSTIKNEDTGFYTIVFRPYFYNQSIYNVNKVVFEIDENEDFVYRYDGVIASGTEKSFDTQYYESTYLPSYFKISATVTYQNKVIIPLWSTIWIAPTLNIVICGVFYVLQVKRNNPNFRLIALDYLLFPSGETGTTTYALTSAEIVFPILMIVAQVALYHSYMTAMMISIIASVVIYFCFKIFYGLYYDYRRKAQYVVSKKIKL